MVNRTNVRSPIPTHDLEMGHINGGCNRGGKDSENTDLFGGETGPASGNAPDFSHMFGHSKPKQVTKPHPAELVDQASRGLFPLGFTVCNLAYWLYYLYFTDQDLSESNMHGGL